MSASHKLKAFSLIELSIVVTIIAVIATGALSITSLQVNNDKIKTTKERVEQIYQAMGAYLIANKKLPCPAPINLDRNNANYGIANTTDGNCVTSAGTYASGNLVYGAVPTATLELPSELAEDGFGSRFAYIIHKDFTSRFTDISGGYSHDGNVFNVSTISTPPSSIIIIKENPAGRTVTSVAIFALVSYGPNKLGAFNWNATTKNSASSDSDELDNSIGTTSGSNSSNYNNTLIATSNSDSFDDIIFYKTRAQLIADFNAMEVFSLNLNPYYYPYGMIWMNAPTCSDPPNQYANYAVGNFGLVIYSLKCAS